MSTSHVDDNDLPTDVAFRPTDPDHGLPSYMVQESRPDNRPGLTPAQTYQLRTEVIGRESAGIVRITTAVAKRATAPAYADPLVDQDSLPDQEHHTCLDWRNNAALSKSERRNRRLLLLDASEEYGSWLFPPDAPRVA